MSPSLSQRISSLKPSPTVALNAKASAMRAEGHKIYNFAVGEPDFTTPESICQVAIDSIKNGRTKYAPAGGSPALRQAIQEKLKRDNNLDFPVEHIVAGIGAKEILFHIMLALLDEGDEVLVTAPYWVSYPEQIQAAGGKAVIVEMPESSGSRLSAELLAQYASEKTKAVIINSPNNPAGYVLSTEELRSLGAYLNTKDWWVVSDEIYEYMSFEKESVSMLSLTPELKDRYILVNGLSKGFAMTGWRVGYVAAPAPVAKLVKTLQTQSSTCLPPFIEDAAIAALKAGRGVMGDKFELLRERRDLAVACLEKIEGISMVKPEGAFYIFVDIREKLKKSNHPAAADGSFSFGEFLLTEYKVAMVPGEAFGTPGFLRLSYAVGQDDIREGIAALSQALNDL